MCRNEKIPTSSGSHDKARAGTTSRAHRATGLLLLALLVFLGLRLPAEMRDDAQAAIGVEPKMAAAGASAFDQPLPHPQQQFPSNRLGAPPQHSGFGGGGGFGGDAFGGDAPPAVFYAAAIAPEAFGASAAVADDDPAAGVDSAALDADPAGPGPALPSVESAAAPPETFDALSSAAAAVIPSEALDSSVAVADNAPAAGVDPAAPDADPVGLDGAAAPPAEPLPARAGTAPPPAPKKKGRKPSRHNYKRKPAPVPWDKQMQPILYDFPPVKKRLDFIKHLEQLPAFATAVEVGVGMGTLAKGTLDLWESCTEYKLVDAGEKETELSQAQYRVKKWPEKTEFLVLPLTAAAEKLADAHFDFVYLSDRHDYCAVIELMARYWPKLRPGGILGGNNYVEKPPEDWGKCEDGSLHPDAVRGAVDDFRKEQGNLDIYIAKEKLPSWYIQKPY